MNKLLNKSGCLRRKWVLSDAINNKCDFIAINLRWIYLLHHQGWELDDWVLRNGNFMVGYWNGAV